MSFKKLITSQFMCMCVALGSLSAIAGASSTPRKLANVDHDVGNGGLSAPRIEAFKKQITDKKSTLSKQINTILKNKQFTLEGEPNLIEVFSFGNNNGYSTPDHYRSKALILFKVSTKDKRQMPFTEKVVLEDWSPLHFFSVIVSGEEHNTGYSYEMGSVDFSGLQHIDSQEPLDR